MKMSFYHYWLSVLVMLLGSIVSCSKSTSGDYSVVGQWELNFEKFVYTIDDIVWDESTRVLSAGDAIFDFSSEGVLVIHDGGQVDASYVYEKRGNTLILRTDSWYGEYSIKELSSTRMVLVYDEDYGENKEYHSQRTWIFTRL